jgi:hypothetical protein
MTNQAHNYNHGMATTEIGLFPLFPLSPHQYESTPGDGAKIHTISFFSFIDAIHSHERHLMA